MCGNMAKNYNNLVMGSSMRKKLQNSKGYAESPEFLPALGLFIFQEEVRRYNWRQIRSLVRSITFFWYIYIYIMDRPDYITLLACTRG